MTSRHASLHSSFHHADDGGVKTRALRATISSIAIVSFLAACSDSSTERDDIQPAALADLDPRPNVVEVEIVAEIAEVEILEGKRAEVWAFRDASDDHARATVPGPLLEANRGDQVLVHFRNELPEETTVHWHGLRVPNGSDGTPAAQQPVAAGGTFDYAFTVEDEGLFWYHPHMHGDVQIERGLYAPVLVHGDVAPDVTHDRVLVLDDVKIEADGRLSERIDPLDYMVGRQGNVQVVNGRRQPTVRSQDGARERWRLVNVANGRFFNLELPGHSFLVIGWDGGPLVEPYETDTLLISPGERYDVLVELDGADELALRNIYYDRGHELPDPGPIELMTIELDGKAPPLSSLPTSWGAVEALPIDADTVRRSFVLAEDASGDEPTFSINDEQYPDITPLVVSEGTVEIWEVENGMEMDHPFHLHGMSFQVLDDAGVAPVRLGWKDTVNIPRDTTAQLAVRYAGTGRWMYHCHILEHAERGMMGELVVEPGG